MILAGDIGGTKTYLALFDQRENRLEKIHEARFENRLFSDFYSILEEFFKEDQQRPKIISLGVAGPIENGNCKLTNLDWIIETDSLKKYSNRVFLINDLVALACAVPFLESEDLAVLQSGQSVKGNISVIAAGTGLGQAFLFPTADNKYYVVDSEGGHADFSPRNKLETELHFFLQKKFSRISVERVISGPGLIQNFEFIKKKFHKDKTEPWEKGLQEEELASNIIDRGLEKQSEICEKALSLFVELYGALAGNLALQFLARGGVFLGGGIAPRILPLLNQGSFMKAFLSKGRFEKLLGEVPVKVILNDKAALLGAAKYALAHRFVHR
ncbi:MAG: glucokinase [Nitrospinae bacterium]|nr:glucokinase [Nitrospinota bacterium]